jgi:hypothetical protein
MASSPRIPRFMPAPARCANRDDCNRGGATMYKASITAVLLALGLASLVQAGSNAMVVPTAGLRDSATPAIVEPAALRRGGRVGRRGAAVGTRHVATRHRGVAVRTRHVAARHRGVAVRSRHVAVRHRGVVAARRTHVAVDRRRAMAAKPTAVVRPVRPWVRQPYYGTVFDGVTLGTVIAAAAVPTSPSFDLCWYWSNSSKTRGYWDFCQ